MAYVHVIFVQDWDTETEAPEWGDWEAMARYLTQWDYGTETDDAHTETDERGRYGAGAHDTLMRFTIGGLDYVLSVNHDLHYAGLARDPLSGH